MTTVRGTAWVVVVLMLVSAVVSVLTDPYFDRFSDGPDTFKFERDGGSRPAWRMSAVSDPVIVLPQAWYLVGTVRALVSSVVLVAFDAAFVPPRA
jgi:hypothetical protein